MEVEVEEVDTKIVGAVVIDETTINGDREAMGGKRIEGMRVLKNVPGKFFFFYL